MRTGRTPLFVVVLLALLVAAPALSRAQSSSGSPRAAVLASFARWKAAVRAGNRTSLAAFYSSAPPSQNQTPQGKTQDPNEEPAFWSALAAKGLSDFQPKILSTERPQPGEVALVLRIEFRLKTSSGAQPFTVEGAQVWVQQGTGWRIVMTHRSDPAASPTFRLPVPAKPNTNLYPPPEEARSEIAAALASAAKDRKRVILVFGANWCYDCHVLDAAFHSKAIAPLVNANYHVVHVNVGDDGTENLDLAESYGVPLKKAVRVPSLAVLDPNGKVVYSQKNGEFDDSVKLAPADVTAFLTKWAPSPSS
jgi:thioredoxin 1